MNDTEAGVGTSWAGIVPYASKGLPISIILQVLSLAKEQGLKGVGAKLQGLRPSWSTPYS